MAKSNSGIHKKPRKIYLDYAASVLPNPSSIHEFGLEAKENLEGARTEAAQILGARKAEIIFTSGGTEGNNLAIQGLVFACQGKVIPHIITTDIEHPSVLETCKLLQKRKLAEISIIPVEANGIVDPKKIKKAIKKNTVLVSVMYANNEIGTIQPLKEIAKELRHYKKQNKYQQSIFLHTDAVQAVNYLDLNVDNLGVDMLTLSGSKIEGAGRVGVLYKNKLVPLLPVWGGGDQEMGLRPGTENIEAIAKFSSALRAAQTIKEKEGKRLTELRDYFLTSLTSNFLSLRPQAGPSGSKKLKEAQFIVNGDVENRLPNNINITFSKIPSDLLVIELSAKGIMTSSKSACKSSREEGSYVIKALRPEADPEIGGLRFSLGKETTKKDIDYTVRELGKILKKLEKWYN